MKFSPGSGASLLAVGVVVSLLLLGYARAVNSSVTQLLAVLVSMGLMFYSSHPLGPYITARAYGVSTEYFFLGRSDFRKLGLRPMSALGAVLPTVGTKLRKSELAPLPPRKRGYIFGSGVIFSIAFMAVQLVYVFVSGFNLLSSIFALLLFLATLATEVLFSTEVGDLAKMTREFRKSRA